MLPRFTESPYSRRLSTRQRSILYLLAFVAILFVVILSLVPLRDLRHYKAYFDSKRKNEADNNFDEDNCYIRNEPVVLVEGTRSVRIVFEGTCGLIYKFSVWTVSDSSGAARYLDIDSLAERKTIDRSHYPYHKILGPSHHYHYFAFDSISSSSV